MTDPGPPVTISTEKGLIEKSTEEDLKEKFKEDFKEKVKDAAQNRRASGSPPPTGQQPQGAAVPAQTSGPPSQATPPPAQDTISSSSGAKFQVLNLTPDVNSYAPAEGLSYNGKEWRIGCGGVDFAATVRFEGKGTWKIGWVQTAEPANFWVLYKKRSVDRGQLHRGRTPKRMKDGDSEDFWYGDESYQVAGPAEGTVTVTMMDDPVISFCYPKHPGGSGLEALRDKQPFGCGGQKEFWTWLVAVREDEPAEMVYLHHIHWVTVFNCTIEFGGGRPKVTSAGAGARPLSQGAGQGGATPVLDGPPPRSSEQYAVEQPQ
jgi:hypothetical protein